MSEPGPLLPADEYFTHQVVDTFARVAQTDRAWTEKVCAMAAATDGSVQAALGLGKYTNRNVMDAWAGISRGAEQWTVRSSRQLSPDPETTTVGPIRYEILETSPHRRIRFALDANDIVPVSFEWVFESDIPPFIEGRETHISRDGYRRDADVIRFHQSGSAAGWVDVDGIRTEFDDTQWVATRDRSWGVRYEVGAPLLDVAPAVGRSMPGISTYVLWAPFHCRRSDGSEYGLHLYYQRISAPGFERSSFEGGVESPDGRRVELVELRPDLRFDDATRRFLGGTLTAVDRAGATRELTVTPVSDTGFHLATGLYGGFDDHWHGQWRGVEHVDGEYFADCTDPGVLARVGQHRQAVVRVEDPTEDGIGFGDLQSIIMGAHPEIGLTETGIRR